MLIEETAQQKIMVAVMFHALIPLPVHIIVNNA